MGHSSGGRGGSNDDKNPVRPDGATGTTNARSEPANLALLTPLAAKYHNFGVASPAASWQSRALILSIAPTTDLISFSPGSSMNSWAGSSFNPESQPYHALWSHKR